MNNKKRFRLLITFIAIVFLLFTFIRGCIVPFIRDISEHSMGNEEIKRKQKKGRSEAVNLFTQEVAKKLVSKYNFVSKSKHAYSVFLYDKKYEIVVHKIILPGNLPLKKLVDFNNETVDISPDVVYAGYEEQSYLKFSYSSEYDSLAKKIFITYDKNLLGTTTIGDSIINYNFLVTNLSVRYKLEGARDMVFKCLQPNALHPEPLEMNMNVALYKKGSSVFIIVLYPRERKIILDNGFLPSLLGVKSWSMDQ